VKTGIDGRGGIGKLDKLGGVPRALHRKYMVLPDRAVESKGSVEAGGLRGSEESGGIVQVLKRRGIDLNIDVSLIAFVC